MDFEIRVNLRPAGLTGSYQLKDGKVGAVFLPEFLNKKGPSFVNKRRVLSQHEIENPV